MRTALDQEDYLPSPAAQLVGIKLGQMKHPPEVDTSTVMLITDVVLSVIADEAWQLQEQADWHEKNGTDGTVDGQPVNGQPLHPEWVDVARWMQALRG